ncbi:MAG: hypothetical protein HDR97_08090 [Bacteroides sp.]|nr:hypothetical protein [Bacteroides sp.]
MTRLIILTFLLLGMMHPMKSSAAPGTPTVTLPMGKSSGNGGGKEDGGDNDDDKKNKRIPSARVICTIDFVNLTVTGNFSSDLLSYEVWDEEGQQCLESFTQESTFVEYLYSAEGIYQLRFYSDSYVYIGYISID